jgi:CMP-N-acetylneuraminic acid synthetase
VTGGGVLGVIPARGGSRAIPRKNIALLAGRPLLAYTCAAALASMRLTRVILSTDDEEIAAVGRRHGVGVPFQRAPGLAGNETGMLEVLQDAVARVEAEGAGSVDVVVLLQPTSPLRRAHHIDAAVDLLVATGADSVVSVVEVPHQFGPVSLMRLDGDRLLPL